MDNLQNITLPNGAVLRIVDGIVTCTDAGRLSVYLTAAQQKMILTLAQKINLPVSMAELYTGYTGDAVEVDSKGIRDNVAKMKNTMPRCVRDCIQSARGYGYALIGTSEKETNGITPEESLANRRNTRSNRRIAEMAGDYYGFSLDPLGKGNVLASFFHIENVGTADSPQMAVSAIVGIRDKEILLTGSLSQIFEARPSDYHDLYVDFKKNLSDNNKRCIWLQGHLSSNDNLVTMHLASNNSNESWTVILDIAEYLCCGRDWERENNRYRGGLGLVLAVKTAYGTISFRLGLVRKSFIKRSMIHASEDMKDWLKLMDDSKNAVWKPLKLSTQLDKIWYDWFMNA